MPLLTRRRFSGLLASALTLPLAARAAEDPFAAIEARIGGRLGVAILDTGSGASWARRDDERFPLCSTFKVLAVGAVLARVDAGAEDLDEPVPIAAAEVVEYSPVTGRRAGGEMRLAEICEAALTRSDNTAGNLLLKRIGGPAGLTAFARTLDDAVTRLDRWETDLNAAIPGDPRDTTTPEAMVDDLGALLLGDRLSPTSAERLIAWMRANATGDAKLRAGLPAGWQVADKTGGGDHGATADVAVIWPPTGDPLIVAVYIHESPASFDARNAAIAEVARRIPGLVG
ncbi:Beta-lactamase FAR-1 [uncultured Alphaproteobacteria bacterium]|uniref:Beta-lactamase n=1 Tax=uncultured Alphaproteobacteria bacterium TaxID=91750 RepID=A0A212JU75_9PROT|nr:Beta-lactamase FAR-1 [uncultured Alphaproteobacteria bacterium]